MKKYFLLLALFFTTTASAENWYFYYKTPENNSYYGIYDEYFIDLDSIRLMEDNTREAEIKKTAGHLSYTRGKLKHSVGVYRYDCQKKQREHLFSVNTYRDNRQIKINDYTSDRIEKIPPNTILELEWKTVCSAKINKQH